MSDPRHIGIAACSAEGAALCYKTICAEGAAYLGEHAHPEVSMHTPSLADYNACIYKGDWRGVGEIMLASAEKLKRAGADFLICPDNTIHQGLSFIRDRSPLPWLHIAEVVANEAVEKGYRKLGLTGTKWLVESDVYPDILNCSGLSFIRPERDVRKTMNHLIMDELVKGVFKETTIQYFEDVIKNLANQDCDAVILGCTEIPLIISDRNSTLPTLDSARLLARAALKRAVEERKT